MVKPLKVCFPLTIIKLQFFFFYLIVAIVLIVANCVIVGCSIHVMPLRNASNINNYLICNNLMTLFILDEQ